MNSIILKTCSCLIILSILFLIMFSCGKSGSSTKVLEKVDTVKYVSLLNNSVGWCISVSVPPYDSIRANPFDIGVNSNATGFSHYECGNNQDDSITFTVNKFRNIPIRLSMWGAMQDIGGNPPDSAVTLTIYLNDTIVATQSSSVKDSIQYTIN